jgi:predicted FMN-binding regulatory protein PaiB/GNAT superfamily N-acetyltransferase
MRKAEWFRMERPDAVDLLDRAAVVHVAASGEDGTPILRTVHGVVVDGHLAWHGAPAGEKMESIGREAVVSAEETVASIPSFFWDAERACPATTYYRAAQVHGVIERVDDPVFKARALEALMHKLQPEGGYVPLSPAHPRYAELYEKAVKGILVLRVSLERLEGKSKLGQNRSKEDRAHLYEQLWRRGTPMDLAAIDTIRAANPHDETPRFLAAPEGYRLTHRPGGTQDLEDVAEMLVDAYWNVALFDRPALRRAHVATDAWVGARDATGRLVATARAISDGVKQAWVYDVMVSPEHRRKKLGTAVMRLLLDHPRVRDARFVWLGTSDAQPLYGSLGFIERSALPPKPYPTTEMVLRRPH